MAILSSQPSCYDPNAVLKIFQLPYFSDYKMHPPTIWEEKGGASYSPNVAYLACYRISALKDVIKYFTTFFASKIFFLFSSSKT